MGNVGRAISKPFVAAYNYVVKPVCSFVSEKIVQPVYNTVVKPVYDTLIKPIYERTLKPVVDKVWDGLSWVKEKCQPLINAWNESSVGKFVKQYVVPVVEVGSYFCTGGVGLLAKGFTYAKKAVDFIQNPTSILSSSILPSAITNSRIYKAVTDNKVVNFAQQKYRQFEDKIGSSLSSLKKKYEESPVFSKVNNFIRKGGQLVDKSTKYYNQNLKPYVDNFDQIKDGISEKGFQNYLLNNPLTNRIKSSSTFNNFMDSTPIQSLRSTYNKIEERGTSLLSSYKQKYQESPIFSDVDGLIRGRTSFADFSKNLYNDRISPLIRNAELRDLGSSFGSTFNKLRAPIKNLGFQGTNHTTSTFLNNKSHQQLLDKINFYENENSGIKLKLKQFQTKSFPLCRQVESLRSSLVKSEQNLSKAKNYSSNLQKQLRQAKGRLKANQSQIQALKRNESGYQQMQTENRQLKLRLAQTQQQFNTWKRTQNQKSNRMAEELQELRGLKLKKEKEERQKLDKIQPILLDNSNKQILKKFFTKTPASFQKLWKATVDGFPVQNFLKKHGKQSNILVICKNEYDKIIGGYSANPFWVENQVFDGRQKNIKDSSLTGFLFSLAKNLKFQLRKDHDRAIIRWVDKNRFTFGNFQFWLCGPTGGCYRLNENYQNCKQSNSTESRQRFIGTTNDNCKMREWEIWKVKF